MMNSKKMLFVCIVNILLSSPTIAFGQDIPKIVSDELSPQGQLHYKRAEMFKTISAVTLDEIFYDSYQGHDSEIQIINEYEAITQTDPNYAPVYYELGLRCILLAKEMGEPYFSKAEKAFRKYGSLSKKSIEDHLAVIDKLRNKYNQQNSYTKYTGKWAFTNGQEWYIDISYDRRNYSFSLNPNSNDYDEIVDQAITSNEIIYTIKKTTDHRTELREKGWKYYYDDCNLKADSGYSTTGEYKYDKSVIYATISISLSGSVPTYSVRKFHNIYYYQGFITYADTDIRDSSSAYKIEMFRIK